MGLLHRSVEEAVGRGEESRSTLKVGDQNDAVNPGEQKTLVH